MGGAKIDHTFIGIIRYFDNVEDYLLWGSDESKTIFHGKFRCPWGYGTEDRYEWGPGTRDMKCIACGEEIPPSVIFLLKIESTKI